MANKELLNDGDESGTHKTDGPDIYFKALLRAVVAVKLQPTMNNGDN